MPQQASFEAVRAVESGRPAVLAAVSGTSVAFDARERRLIWVDQHETGAWIVAALAAIPLVAVRVARRLLTEPDRFTRGTRVAAGGPVVPVLGAVPPSHRPRLAVLAAIAFAAGLITGPVATLLLVYAENVLDVSSAVTAGLVVAAGLTELAGLMLGRLLADHLGRRPTAALALMLMAGAGALTYSGSVPALAVGYLCGVLFGAAYGTSAVALTAELFPTSIRSRPSTCHRSRPEYRATSLARSTSRGAGPRTTTARSGQPTSSGRFTAAKASIPVGA